MNVAATLADTRFVNSAYMLDLQTLEDGITLRDGTHIDLDMRIDKADGQQKAKDTGTSSGASYNSCSCTATIHRHADLTACLACRERTLDALVQTARKCAEVPGFETRIDLRGSTKASLVALVHKLDGSSCGHLLAPAVLAKAQALTNGQVGEPAILGGLAYESLTMLRGRGKHTGLEVIYDSALHAAAGQSKEMHRCLLKLLSKPDRGTLALAEKRAFGEKCAYTCADVRLRLFALPWMVRESNLVSANTGRAAHMLSASRYWARLHPVCFRPRYAHWHNNYWGCVLRATALFFLYVHELMRAAPPRTAKGDVSVLYLTYFHQGMHAVERLQYMPGESSEAERCEAQFRSVRVLSGHSNNHLQNMQDAVLAGLQMEAFVKEEYGTKGEHAAVHSDKRFHTHYAKSSLGAADEENLRFGWEHWGQDSNWQWMMILLAPFTQHRECWRIEGVGDTAVFVLICGRLSLWLPTARLDFARHTLGDVRTRAKGAYAQLAATLTDSLERRVLLGEGLPSRPSPAVPRKPTAAAAAAAARVAAAAGPARYKSKGESDGEESEASDDDESDDDESGDEGSEGGGPQGGAQGGEDEAAPDPYELTSANYYGDRLTATRPRGLGVTVERWERRPGSSCSARTVTYAGEHQLSEDGVTQREGHGTERCEDKHGSQRMQGQWRADCLYGLGECQYSSGSVHRGQWVLESSSQQEVLQGWGARYRCAGAPTPYEYGKFELDEYGCSVLAGGVDERLPEEHTEALEAALEAAAQAAAAGERAVRVAAARNGLPGSAEGDAAGPAAEGDAAGSAPPPDSNAARWMRKALLEGQQQLVDAFEEQRRANDDAARTAALHAVLDAIATTSLRDERHMNEHGVAGGRQWEGTEAGVGTMASDTAQATWLRFGTAEKVWLMHDYDIANYRSKRKLAAGLLLEDWHAGRAANLPAIDVAAMLLRCVAKQERQMAPRGENVAKRKSSGAMQASTSVGMGAERAPLPRASAASLNAEIDAMQAKIKELKVKKQKLQSAEDRSRAPPPPAAATRGSRLVSRKK